MIRGYLTILGPEVRRMHVYLIWAVVYGIAQGASMLLIVPIARDLFRGDFAGAGRWLLIAVPVVLLSCGTFYVQAMRAFEMAIHTMRALHHRLGDHLVTLPLGWFTRDRTGSVSQIAVKGTMFVGNAGAHLITPVVTNTVASATVAIGMLLFDWRIGLVAVLGGVFLWWVSAIAGKMIWAAESRNNPAAVAVNDRILEFARYQPTLRAFGRSGTAYEPLEDALNDQHRIGRSVLGRSVVGIMLSGIAVQAVFTAILVVGAALAITGNTEAALLMAVVGVAIRFTDPLAEVAALGSAVRGATTEIERITDILDTDPVAVPDAPKQPDTRGSVELEGVTFGYGPDRTVLREVSLRVPQGSMTALVGPSGSGKTTVTRLIARFYDADSGAVRVGGTDVREQDTETLMAQLSLVFQDVYLFDDTLWENIRIGRPDATDDEIQRAARTAGVDGVVDRLPEGWDTRVGEAGSALSGGERQRVSIARALVKDAPVVLFDEATSALDPENEAHVAASIRTLAERATVLVIAHKISTVLAADQIVVLTADGRVDDVGTHDDLLARGGTYAEFWRQRNDAEGWTMAVS